MESSGKFLGKKVFTYDSGVLCSPQELEKDLASFEQIALLRHISDLSAKLFKRGNKFSYQGDVPLSDDFLLFLSQKIAEIDGVGNYEVDEKNMTILFRKARSVYDALDRPELLSSTEMLLRIAYRDFQYQELLLNSIGRTVYIYAVLWDQISSLNSSALFEQVVGTSLDNFLVHLLARLGADEGNFFRSDDAVFAELNSLKSIMASVDSEAKFLDWAAATIKKIRSYNGNLKNPLRQYPIVDTEWTPPECRSPVFLIQSKHCLFFKFTYNLYFDFCTAFDKGGRDNQFKQEFGKVFEAYVGKSLERAFTGWSVIPEIEYREGRNLRKTVDWFVRKNHKLILIEVKQSSVFLNTKESGTLHSFREDVKKTVLKAAEQLELTKALILAGQTPELSVFRGVTYFKKVCVLADPLYLGNMLLEELSGPVDDMHLVNISDFENLLELQKRKEGLFYLLHEKESDPRLKASDFKEFLIEKYGRRAGRVQPALPLQGFELFTSKYKL